MAEVHVHDWKYLFGQGRWYQCQDPDCKAVGDMFSPGNLGTIVEVECDHLDCKKPATSYSAEWGVKCADHKHLRQKGSS